jgi:hypothetical protein
MDNNLILKLWDECPSFVISSPGGGKTAFRMELGKAFWNWEGENRRLPIQYKLRYPKKIPPTLEEFTQQIIEAGAVSLLLGFSYFPDKFLNLSGMIQRDVVGFISNWVQNLTYFLDSLETSGERRIASGEIGDIYSIFDLPNQESLLKFIDKFKSYYSSGHFRSYTPIKQSFDDFISMVINDIGYHSIFILMDGLDGFAEFAESPSFTAKSIVELLNESLLWSEKHIFIKLFLNSDASNCLESELGTKWYCFQKSTLHWDLYALAEMIRKRIYVATNGQYASLHSMSDYLPFYQDIELFLAKIVFPLPREMLWLVRKIMSEYDSRNDRSSLINSDDIENAIRWYREQVWYMQE